MKLRWKILGGLTLALILGGTYAYQNRVDIILNRVAKMGKPEVGPAIDINLSLIHISEPTRPY